jgi:hypothetical protein
MVHEDVPNTGDRPGEGSSSVHGVVWWLRKVRMEVFDLYVEQFLSPF